MKALKLIEPGKVVLAEVAEPRPADDQLLVRTGAALICTSDLNDIASNPFGIELPSVIGHEGAGTVVAVGRGVRGFRTGDRVAAHPVHPCGRCANCRDGMGHLCQEMGHFGINMPGTFAEAFLVRQDRARVLPAGVPMTTAALAEPVCVCLEALAQADLPEGGRLLIIGDGPFGAIMARLADAMPLEQTVIAGHHDFRLGFAGGALRIRVGRGEEAREALLAPTGGRGYDAVILAVGRAEAAQLGLGLLKARGRMVVFSAIQGQTPLDLFSVHVRELEIVGACNDRDRLDEAVAWLAGTGRGIEELVTHRLSLECYEEALELARSGREEAMKVAFVFDEAEAP
jgi:threonine dehydrogenase-like Zn-dependent dehydrogenase